MDNRKYIGMDVHQASISVAVRDGAGKLVMECVVETKAATVLEFHPRTARKLMGGFRGRNQCGLVVRPS